MSLLDVFRPKWKHSDVNVRKEAIDAITDQNILIVIAENDEDMWVRVRAIDRLTNQEVLEKIANSNKAPDERAKATEKLTDQKILADLAKKDKEPLVRIRAIEKLKDQVVLAGIVKNEKERDLRKRAFANLTDLDVIADIERFYEKKNNMTPQVWKDNPDLVTKMKKIALSQNLNGWGCSLYVYGMCMARAIGQKDASVGPEPCSVHDAGFNYCALFQMFGNKA